VSVYGLLPFARDLRSWIPADKLQPYIRLLSDDLSIVEPAWRFARFPLIGLSAFQFSRRTHQVQKAPVRPVCHALQVSSQSNGMTSYIDV